MVLSLGSSCHSLPLSLQTYSDHPPQGGPAHTYMSSLYSAFTFVNSAYIKALQFESAVDVLPKS